MPSPPTGLYTCLDIAGFDLPNVFNRTDLSMGNHWIEMYRLDSGNWILVPLTGERGERLNSLHFDILNFTNHNSDLLYFGTTLAFRRGVMGHDFTEFFQSKFGFSNLERRIRYDYNWNQFDREKEYLVRVYSNSASKVTHEKTDLERFSKQMIYEAMYNYDGNELIKK